MTKSKIIGQWSGCTHGKYQFATLADAEEYASGIASVPLGWYWTAGDIEKYADGSYWVVVP